MRLLSNSGVTMFEGEGKIVGPHEVELTKPDGTKQHYSAKHILIATGSRAQKPRIPGQLNQLEEKHRFSESHFPTDLEKRKHQLPYPKTVDFHQRKSLPSALREVDLKGSLMDRLLLLENHILQLSYELEKGGTASSLPSSDEKIKCLPTKLEGKDFEEGFSAGEKKVNKRQKERPIEHKSRLRRWFPIGC